MIFPSSLQSYVQLITHKSCGLHTNKYNAVSGEPSYELCPQSKEYFVAEKAAWDFRLEKNCCNPEAGNFIWGSAKRNMHEPRPHHSLISLCSKKSSSPDKPQG